MVSVSKAVFTITSQLGTVPENACVSPVLCCITSFRPRIMWGVAIVERFVLGAVLLNGGAFASAATALSQNDFSLDRHRRIWRRMGDLHARAVNL